MLWFYDYLFLFIYNFYSPKEKGALATSAMIIAALQASNVFTLIMAPSIFGFTKAYINAFTFIGVYAVFWIVTYIRYVYKEKVTIQYLEEKWEKETEARKTKIRLLRTLYITLSLTLVFGTAIYLGTMRHE